MPGREVTDMQQAPLELRLFGSFSALVNGVPLPRLRSRKGMWLLALLALRSGRPISREWLTQTLWPDSESSQAFYNLRQCLTNLRQALGTEADCLLSPTPQTLSLDTARFWADVTAFDTAIADGSLPALEKAIAHYRGSLLEGCGEEWVVSERALREQNYFTALETLANAALTRQQPALAVPHLRLLVTADPFREAAYGVLMQALADCGDFAAVTQVYHTLRLRLHSELNTLPALATDALYQRLLSRSKQPPASAHSCSDILSSSSSPSASSPSSLLPCERPAALSPRRLPVPLTRLIGREAEIQEITTGFKTDRLITLTGAGGVGKSRLALAIGEALASGARGTTGENGMEGGVWFVELAAFSDPDRILPTILKTLGLQERKQRPLLTTLTAALNAPCLLILDNCEHLAEGCARITYDLLYACSTLRVLATSRQPLGITGERVYRVPSLALPPAALPESTHASVELQALQEYAALQLFVERGSSCQSDFHFTGHNAQTIAQICRHLDGIPLAIELGAARLRSLSIEEIQARLEDRFALLTTDNRLALPRHRTLRALIDWSFDLLDAQEQALFRRLSVFSGGWTLEAAQKISRWAKENETQDSADVLNALTALVDKSLVIADTQAQTTRYRMLETMRQYAGEELRESGETETVQRRHRDFFLALADESDQPANKAQQSQWFLRLEAEHDNLLTALAWCQENPEGSEAEFRFCAALYSFWYLRGYLREGRERLTHAAERAAKAQETVWQARMLLRAGSLARMQGDFTYARCALIAALPLAQAAGETGLETYLLILLGSIDLTEGDADAALPLLQRALTVARSTDHRYAESECLVWLGDAARWRGDCTAALAYYTEGLNIAHTLEDSWFAANASGMMAELALQQGDIKEAGRLVRLALQGYIQAGDRIYCAQILSTAAGVAAARGEMERAACLLTVVGDLLPTLQAPLPAPEQELYLKRVRAVRDAMDAKSFAASVEAGRKMDWEQAIACSLEENAHTDVPA